MFQLQHHFNGDDLTRLLNQSLRKWSNGTAKFECLNISCDEKGQVTGYTFMRPTASSEAFDKKSTTVALSRELITSAIYQAASDEGSALAANSLVFSNSKEAGAIVVRATALAAADQNLTECNWPEAALTTPGIVSFPAPVTVFFNQEELQKLIESSGKRAGYTFTAVSLSASESETITANVQVKTANNDSTTSSNLTLTTSRLTQTISTELRERGYILADEGLRYTVSPELGSTNKVSATVSVLAIPNP